MLQQLAAAGTSETSFDGFSAEIDADVVVNMAALETLGSTEADGAGQPRQYSFKSSDDDLAWYVKNDTSEEQAKEWLDDDAVGTFLFRAGGRSDLVLSVKQEEGKDGVDTIFHGKVSIFTGASKMTLFTLDADEGPYFTTLGQMVEKFKRSPYDHGTGNVLVMPLPPGGAKAEKVTMAQALESAKAVEAGGDGLLDIEEDPWWKSKLAKAMYAIIIYFVAGMTFYTTYEDDGFKPFRGIEALYFCVVILTTVGYGDQPNIYKSNVAMLFTSFFVIFGVAAIFTALTVVYNEIIEKRDELKKKAQAKALALLFDSGSEEDMERQLKDQMKSHKGNATEKKSLYKQFKAYQEKHPVGSSVGWVFVGMFVGMMFMMKAEVDHEKHSVTTENSDGTNSTSEELYFQTKKSPGGYTFVQALYWAVVTGTTVGFGDLTPDSDGAIAFLIIYIPAMLALFMAMIGAIQNELRGAQDLESILSMELSDDLIKSIDKSGDGEVSKDEWLRAVLIALHKVDEDLCDLILDHFDVLDVTKDGTLDAADLKAAFGSGDTKSGAETGSAVKKDRAKSMKQKAHDKAHEYHLAHTNKAMGVNLVAA